MRFDNWLREDPSALTIHAEEVTRFPNPSDAYDKALAGRPTVPDPYIRSSLQFRRPAADDRRRDEPGSSQTPSERNPYWGAILAAMSWIMAEALKGFAAHAEFMHPICFNLGEDLDSRDPAARVQSSRQAQAADPDAAGAADPVPQWHRPRFTDAGLLNSGDVAPAETAQTASSSLSARITSPLTELWSTMRRQWQLRQMVTELKALDDRTLNDIGIAHHPIEYFQRNGEHCE